MDFAKSLHRRPGEAGTHNHRRLVGCRKAICHRRRNESARAYAVPMRFAGTTDCAYGMTPMLNFYGREFTSRLLIGSALYPSPAIMQARSAPPAPTSSRCRCGAKPPAARPATRSGR